MDAVSPAQRNLADWLQAQEAGDRLELNALPAATERVCQKLCERLAALVTSVGSRALLTRALYLARIEFPFLQGVQVGTLPNLSLDGLRVSVQGVEATQLRDGLSALVATLIMLLSTFIGEDITVRLVRDVWPSAPFNGLSAEPGTDKLEA
jgi:hypothetical protein